jgi:hypothetical protein
MNDNVAHSAPGVRPRDAAGAGGGGMSLEEWIWYAHLDFDNGWTGPIPVGKKAKGRYKNPWVPARHGFEAVDADREELEQLARTASQRMAGGTEGILALGQRLPAGVLGIDVDAYDGKNGAATLEHWAARWGPLPDTYIVSARRDGVSGIRLYRVPEGFYPKEIPNGGIEFLDRAHRYIVAPPSWHHTGRRYRLILPNGKRSSTNVLPLVDDIPELPQAYLEGLPASTARAGGGEATPEQMRAFAKCYSSGPQPQAVDWVIRSTIESPDADGTRNEFRNALCWAAREAKGGRYGFAPAVKKIRAAAKAAYAARGDRLDVSDFDRLIGFAVAQAEPLAEADCSDRWQSEEYKQAHQDWDSRISSADDPLGPDDDPFEPDDGAPPWKRYPLLTAATLSAPVKPMRWLINGVWAEKSAVVTAGHKKTFKSWMMHARALAVASGRPYLDHFDVHTPGPVLFVCGEGGEDAFINRHQVLANRYGIDPNDLQDLAFGAVTRTSHLDDRTFMAAIDYHLDALQPVAVFIDPLYAVHPPDVDNKMLYERGPMLARLRDRIEHYAALDVGDHFNKTAPARSLDLDHIGYVGMSQWADSWSLQCHRVPYSRSNNRAQLDVEFASRRSGARLYQIDWELERDLSDPMLIAWKHCDWSVEVSGDQMRSVPRIQTYMQRARLILARVDDEPSKATKDEVTKHLATHYKGSGSTRADWRTAWETLVSDGTLAKTEIDGWRDYQGEQRRAKLTVYKCAGAPVDHPDMDGANP